MPWRFKIDQTASEDRHLVTEHDDLDREIRVGAKGQPYELEDAVGRPVENERDIAGCSPHQQRSVKVQAKVHGWLSRQPHTLHRPGDQSRFVVPRRA